MSLPDVTWALGRPTIGLAASLASRLRVYGRDRVPLDGGLVVASNHFSWLDPAVLVASSPRVLYYMVKVEAHNLALRQRLADRLSSVPGLTIVSPPAGAQASPLLTGVLAERYDRRKVVQQLLERHQVAIRPTHPEFGFNGIRFSMHEFNTDEDVDRAAEAVRRELAG